MIKDFRGGTLIAIRPRFLDTGPRITKNQNRKEEKMKRKILHPLLAGVFLIVMAGTTSVLARAPTPGDTGRALEVVARFLDLTEDQREDFAPILQESRDHIKSLEEQRRVLRRELDQLLDSGDYDLSEVGAYTEKIHDLGHQIREVRKERIESLRSILNEEQERKLGTVRRAAARELVIRAHRRLGILPPIVPPAAPPELSEE
jgi:Spy/CpxP family protein refolding chaperone